MPVYPPSSMAAVPVRPKVPNILSIFLKFTATMVYAGFLHVPVGSGFCPV